LTFPLFIGPHLYAIFFVELFPGSCSVPLNGVVKYSYTGKGKGLALLKRHKPHTCIGAVRRRQEQAFSLSHTDFAPHGRMQPPV